MTQKSASTASKFPWHLVSVLVLTLLACSARDQWQTNRPPVYPSGGVVQYEGHPLKDAVVTFLPISGTQTAFGRTDDDGRFELTTFDANDGAVAAEYKVTVTKIVVEHEPNPKDPEHLPPLHHSEYSEIPEMYGESNKTPLTVKIPEGGMRDIALHLEGKPTGKGSSVKRRTHPN